MSAMTPQLQIGENIVSIPEIDPVVDNRPASSHPLKTALKVAATLLLTPVILVVAIAGFAIVLADFTWFRLKELRYGHPQPKGLWEF